MTAPIRPGFAPFPPAAPQPSAQALAAQRAFFQAAMDRAGAPATPPPIAKPTTPAQAPTATAAAPEAASEPLPRPGRYLDIRV